MKVIPTASFPCCMKPGEVRRVPQQKRPGNLVGYHVCCLRCGFTSHCVNDSELQIEEGDHPSDITLSKEVQCIYCRVTTRIVNGEIELKEGPDVRNVRYQ